MNFGNQRVRITGVGPWSAQWEYLETNRDVARRVLAELEDRRVLADPYGREDPEYCRRSADDIRRIMTRELSRVEQGDDLDKSLRAIRRACRDFLEKAGPKARSFKRDIPALWSALEELRVAIAPHVRSMAMAYGVLLDPLFEENLPRQQMTATRIAE